jgi:hypothetical protein
MELTLTDIEQIKQWIAALRSGEYPQGQLTLQSNEGYCCLGVACKVLIPEDELITDADGKLYGPFPYSQPAAPQWLKEINDDYGRTRMNTLSELNDSKEYQKSFKEIANILEETYINNYHEND